MPQWRKLYTKSTESQDLNDMPDDFHRLLWLMLPLGLCREGRGLDNPAWIKAKIMPLRMDVTPADIDNAMAWYENNNMVQRYTVDGRKYFQVRSWSKYQNNTAREAESIYPPRPIESIPSHEPVATNSRLDKIRGDKIRGEGDFPKILLPVQAQDIFTAITGMMSIPNSRDRNTDHTIENIYDLRKQYSDRQDMVDDGAKYYNAWKARKYSKTNTAWIDWWIAKEIPAAKSEKQKAPTSVPTEVYG